MYGYVLNDPINTVDPNGLEGLIGALTTTSVARSVAAAVVFVGSAGLTGYLANNVLDELYQYFRSREQLVASVGQVSPPPKGPQKPSKQVLLASCYDASRRLFAQGRYLRGLSLFSACVGLVFGP
jgi:hypothetical protein